jgi:hypothetical protein
MVTDFSKDWIPRFQSSFLVQSSVTESAVTPESAEDSTRSSVIESEITLESAITSESEYDSTNRKLNFGYQNGVHG